MVKLKTMEKLTLSESKNGQQDPYAFFTKTMETQDTGLSAPYVALNNGRDMSQTDAMLFLKGYAKSLALENPDGDIDEKEYIEMALSSIYATAYETWYFRADNCGSLKDSAEHPDLNFWENIAKDILKTN
jgi:hypothetical protein